MDQGIIPDKKLNTREVYGDIIDLPHWEPSARHPRMTLHDRAAQFAPFAALAGYDEMVGEEARLTDRRINPEEGQQDLIGRKLNRIDGALVSGRKPVVTFTCFIPDERKSGGRYEKVTAQIRHVGIAERKVFLITRDRPDLPEFIPFDRIMDIRGDVADDLDD